VVECLGKGPRSRQSEIRENKRVAMESRRIGVPAWTKGFIKALGTFVIPVLLGDVRLVGRRPHRECDDFLEFQVKLRPHRLGAGRRRFGFFQELRPVVPVVAGHSI